MADLKDLYDAIVVSDGPPAGHFETREHDGIRYVTTPGIRELDRAAVESALSRFKQGDWGDLNADDIRANDEVSRTRNGSLLGAYNLGSGIRIWVHHDLTISDIPTILLPDEY